MTPSPVRLTLKDYQPQGLPKLDPGVPLPYFSNTAESLRRQFLEDPSSFRISRLEDAAAMAQRVGEVESVARLLEMAYKLEAVKGGVFTPKASQLRDSLESNSLREHVSTSTLREIQRFRERRAVLERPSNLPPEQRALYQVIDGFRLTHMDPALSCSLRFSLINYLHSRSSSHPTALPWGDEAVRGLLTSLNMVHIHSLPRAGQWSLGFKDLLVAAALSHARESEPLESVGWILEAAQLQALVGGEPSPLFYERALRVIVDKADQKDWGLKVAYDAKKRRGVISHGDRQYISDTLLGLESIYVRELQKREGGIQEGLTTSRVLMPPSPKTPRAVLQVGDVSGEIYCLTGRRVEVHWLMSLEEEQIQHLEAAIGEAIDTGWTTESEGLPPEAVTDLESIIDNLFPNAEIDASSGELMEKMEGAALAGAQLAVKGLSYRVRR